MKDKLKELLEKCDKFFPKGEDFKGNHHICMPDGKLTLYVYVLERKTIFWVDMSDDEFNLDNIDDTLKKIKQDIEGYKNAE
jgi:hypothetical protein